MFPKRQSRHLPKAHRPLCQSLLLYGHLTTIVWCIPVMSVDVGGKGKTWRARSTSAENIMMERERDEDRRSVKEVLQVPISHYCSGHTCCAEWGWRLGWKHCRCWNCHWSWRQQWLKSRGRSRNDRYLEREGRDRRTDAISTIGKYY